VKPEVNEVLDDTLRRRLKKSKNQLKAHNQTFEKIDEDEIEWQNLSNTRN